MPSTPATAPLPPPPAAGLVHLPPAVRAIPTRSGPQDQAGADLLELLLGSGPDLPSALDVDPSVLAAPPPWPPARTAPRRAVAAAEDEVADRQAERLRALTLAGSCAAFAVVFAAALGLAL